MTYDAAIIGAGPAGGFAAAILARRGWRVLLVDRSTFPRSKPCGGCLNADAVHLLQQHNLVDSIHGASTTDTFCLHTPQRSITQPIPRGVALPREEFDHRLIQSAMARGVEFRGGVLAKLEQTHEDHHLITLTAVPSYLGFPTRAESSTITARIVLVADGISGTFLRDHAWANWKIPADSWIGLAATLRDVHVPPHTITMHAATHGYVGLVQYAPGHVHLAAAVDPQFCKSLGPRNAIESILRSTRTELSLLASLIIHGTGPLTRSRSQLGAHRLLLLGDACGYVEPFTGEGISWALQSAALATELLPDPAYTWPSNLAQDWRRVFRQQIAPRHWRCQAMRYALHRPRVLHLLLSLQQYFPDSANLLTRPALAAV